jgi:hypothetical protein
MLIVFPPINVLFISLLPEIIPAPHIAILVVGLFEAVHIFEPGLVVSVYLGTVGRKYQGEDK